MFTSFEESVDLPKDEVEYSIYQKEKCPSTGRVHWQGFVRFKSRKRFSTVKRLLGDNVHIEYARCVAKAIEYCSKEESRLESPIEIGEKPDVKRKLDVVSEIKSGKCPKKIIEENPTIWRSLRQLIQLSSIMSTPRTMMTQGLMLIGPTGCGKTRSAVLIGQFLGVETYFVEPTMTWWDNYHGQETVICDEFRCLQKPSDLLRLVDRYPLQLPVKGGFVNFNSRLVILTTNLPVEKLLGDLDSATVNALKRRIDIINLYDYM